MVQISGLTWAVTVGLVVALLAQDLALGTLRPHRVGPLEARAWSLFYISVALAFGAWLSWAHGTEFGTEYLAGYTVEKSLSTDNVFVFLIIMTTFAAPEEHQHKVLTLGIMLALTMRAIFIALGAALISLLPFMFLIFGLLLIYTAVQLFRSQQTVVDRAAQPTDQTAPPATGRRPAAGHDRTLPEQLVQQRSTATVAARSSPAGLGRAT